MDSDRIERGKQVIPEDALTEIIYTIRTGLDKNDCIPASVSEWSLYNPSDTQFHKNFKIADGLRTEYISQGQGRV